MEEQEKLDKVINMPCSQCGSQMSYSAKHQGMYCESCGNKQPVPTANDMIVEMDFSEGLALEKADKGMGLAQKQFHCNQCGATSLVDPKLVTIECSFCGSKNVNEQAFDTQMIKPAGLIPFTITKDKAAEQFKGWIGSGWFHPSNLSAMAKPEKFSGVYVPFWTYDADTDSSWTADAGYHYYETESYTDSNGNRQTRQVQKTRWVPVSGFYQHWFDDVLVIASKGVTQSRAEEVYPYDLPKLVNYDPQFMIGWKSELYQKDVKEGFKQAEQIMADYLRTAIGKTIPGDTYRYLNVNTRKYNVTFKHVLLPIWISAYKYGDKTYQVIVNGQTGKISGGKPISWIKVTIAILIVIAIAVGLYFLFRKH